MATPEPVKEHSMHALLVAFILLVPIRQAAWAAASFCPALEPASAVQVERIGAGDVAGLTKKLRDATAGTTLLLADGIYTLQPNQGLEVVKPNMTIRGASGNREAVIIEGGGNNISINTSDVTIADLTLRNAKFHAIQVRGERGIARTKLYNVHLMDAGQQLIKVSAGEGTAGKFADDGLVACSLIEYSTYARGTAGSAPSYTNGVDILAGKGWVIRDNVFRRIRSQAGPAGPAILAWRNAQDTVVQRNHIIDCWRGIALGLGAPNQRSRGGATTPYDHQNGTVENNVFLALREPADAAIENNFALNSRIVHNTLYYNDALKHPVDWSIEYRFAPTTATIMNNLTNRPIVKRTPLPLQDAVLRGNVINAATTWFRALAAEDVHLSEAAQAVDKGVQPADSREDFDGDKRPLGSAPDVGADEYTPGGKPRAPVRTSQPSRTK
jgi:hypothetical protein